MKFNHRGAQKKSRQGNLTHQSTPPAKLTKSHDMPLTGFLELATPEPIRQDGPLILGDGALDLQQELVVGVIGDGVVQEGHGAVGPPELLRFTRRNVEPLDDVATRPGAVADHDAGLRYDTALAIQQERAARYRQSAAEIAEPLAKIGRVAYEEGELGILELLDSDRQALDARLRILDLAAAARRAAIDLDRAIGREFRP